MTNLTIQNQMTIQDLESNLTSIDSELQQLEARKQALLRRETELLNQREAIENQMQEYDEFADELKELIERYPNVNQEFIVDKVREIKDNDINTEINKSSDVLISNNRMSDEEYEDMIQDIIKEHGGDLCSATDKLIDLGKNYKEKFTDNQLEDLRVACSLCDTRSLITRDEAIKQADNLNYGSEHFDNCLAQLKSLLAQVESEEEIKALENDYIWLSWFVNRQQWSQVINLFKETVHKLTAAFSDAGGAAHSSQKDAPSTTEE